MNAISLQVRGYSTTGYISLFTSPSGADLLNAHSTSFTSLLYTSQESSFQTYLGSSSNLSTFLQSDNLLPPAEWISPTQLVTHNQIFSQHGYQGPANWYKAAVQLDPAEDDVNLTEEEKRVDVPTMLILPERDFAVIKEMQVAMTSGAMRDQGLLRIESVSAGHWAMWEVKGVIEQLLEGFSE